VISANVADRDLRSVVNDIQKRIDTSVQLPEGYHIEYGGQFESEQAASRTLALTSFISIVVIFLLLYNEFRSVKESGVIFAETSAGTDRWCICFGDYNRRGQYSGYHRFHFLVRYCNA
jgi:Cu/Ag efflux pump CusA